MANNDPQHSNRASNLSIWQQPDIIRWSQILAHSYHKLLGKNLIDSTDLTIEPEKLAEALFYAPFVLVSHGTQPEPIFNYGNQTALQLWSLSWNEFVRTPSASSAESVERADREDTLKQAREQGYLENYQGIGISSVGRRFAIEQVTLWNLTDESGQKYGQAATYPSWKFIE